MKFTETPLPGAYVVELEPFHDDRGFFARGWCQNEFEAAGLKSTIRQANISSNKLAGTMRGMHYQAPPHGETKLVRCVRGALYDVIIDVREGSKTFGQWFGIELTAENDKMLYIPEQFAHGFITLVDNTEVTYLVTEFYTPGSERGIRYDDPAFNIEWPLEVRVISDKDKSWDDFTR
ncbi:MAG: dTDP-4-dehydrorhamnose 3,5-epimerase [Planctomycetales bacterium]|nr:dTDP-4-dehydrorhamnose 3,5-epimerase [Planctomycetales bacterium]